MSNEVELSFDKYKIIHPFEFVNTFLHICSIFAQKTAAHIVGRGEWTFYR